MILIWDNGWAYSGHAVHFVDIGEFTADEVHRACNLTSTYGDAYVIGVASEIEWRVPRELEALARFLHPSTFADFLADAEDKSATAFDGLVSRELLRYLVREWRASDWNKVAPLERCISVVERWLEENP